jgi:hypothetical protein
MVGEEGFTPGAGSGGVAGLGNEIFGDWKSNEGEGGCELKGTRQGKKEGGEKEKSDTVEEGIEVVVVHFTELHEIT